MKQKVYYISQVYRRLTGRFATLSIPDQGMHATGDYTEWSFGKDVRLL